MAQVTMDSKEYLELVNAQKELEQLKMALVAGFKFEYAPESWSKYKMEFKPVLPQNIIDRMTDKVLDVCLKEQELMKELNRESYVVFDTENMQLRRDWGDKAPELVQLLEYPDFQAAYAQCEEEEEE